MLRNIANQVGSTQSHIHTFCIDAQPLPIDQKQKMAARKCLHELRKSKSDSHLLFMPTFINHWEDCNNGPKPSISLDRLTIPRPEPQISLVDVNTNEENEIKTTAPALGLLK